MHKQFLGNVIMRKFLFFLCTMMCPLLHGMQDSPLREIVIANVDYSLHRTLALVNTTYNKIIEDIHRPDKKCIEQWMFEKGIPIIHEKVAWNKDFNQCAWFAIGKPAHPSTLKTLDITLVSLVDKKDIIVTKGSWNNFMKPIIDDTLRLYFKKIPVVCCYGYGLIKVSDHRNNDEFIQYLLTCNGQAESRRCVVKVDNEGIESDLKEVSGIPAVMKAFLQSPSIYEHMGSGEIIKVHKLRDVIMPEEYKKFATANYWYDCALYNAYHGC